MNEFGNAKKCTKQRSKGHYSRKRKCWRKKVKAAAVDIVAEGNLVELETELVVPEDNSVLEEAEISMVSISKIINVETETQDNEDKVTGYRIWWTQKCFLTDTIELADLIPKQKGF